MDRAGFKDHQVFGDVEFDAQPVAIAAGAVGAVEGKEARFDFRQTGAAMGAGVMLGIERVGRLSFGQAPQSIIPRDSRSAVSTESANRSRPAADTVTRSMTASMVCFL
jgi:hypothetical protein